MKYLLDTDIASYYLRGKFNLLEKFREAGYDNLRLSIISVAQMQVLAHKRKYSAINFPRIEELARLAAVLDVDRTTWKHYSSLRAETELVGKPRGELDTLQAGLARQHGLIMVTHNRKHFEDVVQVEDWADA